MGSLKQAIIYDIQYVFVAVILVLLYILLDKRYTKKIRIIDWVAVVILVFLSGMRYNVGSDFQEYYMRYQHYTTFWDSISGRLVNEKVFYYLCHLFSKISKSEYGIFWMCALIMYPALVFVARKITGRPSRVVGCFVFLEFYAMSNNILRQFIAIELIMFGYIALKYKKRVLAVMLFALSFGFHLTAVIGVALIFMSKFIEPTVRNIGRSIGIGVIAVFLWRPFMKLLSNIPVIGHYAHYMNQQGEPVIRYGMIGYILFYAFLAYKLIALSNKITIRTKIYYDVISFIILSLPFFCIATQVSYFHRISVYLYSFSIFAVPDLYSVNYGSTLKNKRVRINTSAMLVCWLLYSNIVSLDNTFWTYILR